MVRHNKTNKLLVLSLRSIFILVLVSWGSIAAQTVFQKSGYAIKGYDPVAYFEEKQAVVGKKEITFSWKNTVWRFNSKANRKLFKEDPERYIPQYGGYCAYAMAKDYIAPVDPEAFTIVDDKLYLNYSKNVRKIWRSKQDKYIEDADRNWIDQEKKLKKEE